MDFHKIWIEQCRAAEEIKEDLGAEKALGYLVGKKLVNFLRATNTYPKFAAEVPEFVAEVKRIFEPHELRGYLTGLRRIGALGHAATDEQFAALDQSGDLDEDPVRGAEDVLLVDRIKELLLD